MAKPRIIIADTDINYIIPLQAKFAEEYPNETDLEIITDADYFAKLFSTPQKADILIVSDQLYSGKLRRHDIGPVSYTHLHIPRRDRGKKTPGNQSALCGSGAI